MRRFTAVLGMLLLGAIATPTTATAQGGTLARQYLITPRPGVEAHNALTAAAWSGRYVWAYPVSGTTGDQTMMLVTFHRNWADMKQPTPSFDQVMIKQLGEKGYTDWNRRVAEAMTGLDIITLRFRPDLSVMRP